MAINIAISAVAAVFGGFETFKYALLFFGFFISLLVKEVNAKNEYMFYYNNGLSKIQLIVYGFLINFFVSMIFILVVNLLLKLL